MATGRIKKTETITREQFKALCDALEGHPVLLPVQIAYYTGLRLGEVCALTWEDVDFDGHMLTVRRSMRYNGATHRTELGTTKRAKIRSVAFGDTLDKILRAAKAADGAAEAAGGERYRNYYKLFIDKGRSHYGLFTLEAGKRRWKGITSSTLSASGRTGASPPQISSRKPAANSPGRSRNSAASTSTCSATPTPATS